MNNNLEWMTWDSIVQLWYRMSLDNIPLDGRTLRMTRASLDALWKEVHGDWDRRALTRASGAALESRGSTLNWLISY